MAAKNKRIELTTYLVSSDGHWVGDMVYSVPEIWFDKWLICHENAGDIEDRIEIFLDECDYDDTQKVYWAAVKSGMVKIVAKRLYPEDEAV